MKITLNVPYIDDGTDAHKLDVYAPEGDVKGAAVWFYGGGFKAGKREDYAFMAENLTANGYALVLPTYRLMPETLYPDFIYDAAFAVKKARVLFPEVTLQVGGSSAGAFLSMMLCFDGRYLACAGTDNTAVDCWFFNSAQPTAHYNMLEAKGIDSRRIIVDESAPLWHVMDEKPDVPMLLLCSDNDMYSRRTQNILMYETLLRYGHSAEKVKFETVQGFGHCGYDKAKQEDGVYYLESRIYMLMEMAGKNK